jgi:hypothetical protein
MELTKLLLDGSTTTTNGDVFDASGLTTVSFQLVIDATAATLSATVAIGGSLDLLGDTLSTYPTQTGVVATSTLPGTITIPATGVITLANVAIGRTDLLLRLPFPPKLLRPAYTYTSGGGTVRVRLYAYGFDQDTH